MRGESNAHIPERHIIDWRERKPGAFEQYRYREALYPSSRFRLAYDALCRHHRERVATKAYLAILRLAAQDREPAVAEALRHLIDQAQVITPEAVEAWVRAGL